MTLLHTPVTRAPPYRATRPAGRPPRLRPTRRPRFHSGRPLRKLEQLEDVARRVIPAKSPEKVGCRVSAGAPSMRSMPQPAREAHARAATPSSRRRCPQARASPPTGRLTALHGIEKPRQLPRTLCADPSAEREMSPPQTPTNTPPRRRLPNRHDQRESAGREQDPNANRRPRHSGVGSPLGHQLERRLALDGQDPCGSTQGEDAHERVHGHFSHGTTSCESITS